MSESATGNGSIGLAKAEAALDSGVVCVPGRWDVVVVDGPDSASYLHGQVSQNVEGLGLGATAWSFLLQPQGKVDAWGRLHRVGETMFWFVVSPGFGAQALARLERFKLRVDAELSLSERSGFALRGSGVPDLVFEQGKGVPVDAGWGDMPGIDLIGDSSAPSLDDAWIAGPESLLDVLRSRLGLPAMGHELDEGTIPGAARIVGRSADFTKGCYVGQELVARIDSRGQNTPTRLCRLEASSEGEPFSRGDLLLDAQDAEVGRVTTAVESATFGAVGLGFLKRSASSPALVHAVSPDGLVRSGTLVATEVIDD